MIGKFGVLLGVLLSCASPAEAAVALNPHPYVRQVICDGTRGTAVRISRDRYVSANHVTTGVNCRIDGVPIHVLEADGDNDFSLLKAPPMTGSVKINCGGFKYGQYYHSYGYAWGLPTQWHTPLYLLSSNLGPFGMAILVGPAGTIIPGMSGGGVFNMAGEMVGLNNMYSPFFGHSISRPLSETSLCRSDSARP
jgi:hypothetical protein